MRLGARPGTGRWRRSRRNDRRLDLRRDNIPRLRDRGSSSVLSKRCPRKSSSRWPSARTFRLARPTANTASRCSTPARVTTRASVHNWRVVLDTGAVQDAGAPGVAASNTAVETVVMEGHTMLRSRQLAHDKVACNTIPMESEKIERSR